MSHEKLFTTNFRALFPIFSLSDLFSRSFRMASANLLLSGFVSNPVSWFRTASGIPPTLKATTGFAVACASSSVMPCPSWMDGRAKMSAQL